MTGGDRRLCRSEPQLVGAEQQEERNCADGHFRPHTALALGSVRIDPRPGGAAGPDRRFTRSGTARETRQGVRTGHGVHTPGSGRVHHPLNSRHRDLDRRRHQIFRSPEQRRGKRRDVRRAPIGVPFQGPENRHLQHLGDFGSTAGQRKRRVVAEHPNAGCCVGALREGWSPRQHLVEDGGQRPDIGARVDQRGVLQLLGRHVPRGAEQSTCGRQVPRLDILSQKGLRDPEVQNFDEIRTIATLREVQIRGLQVAVDDAVGMCFGHAFAGLDDVLDGG